MSKEERTRTTVSWATRRKDLEGPKRPVSLNAPYYGGRETEGPDLTRLDRPDKTIERGRDRGHTTGTEPG